MSEGILPLIIDGLVLVLLAATVLIGARLSLQLKAFRKSRQDLENLITSLSTHIDKANNAIGGLQEGARRSGANLQEKINEAQALRDELQIIAQSGDSLAARLERLSDGKGRPPGTGSSKKNQTKQQDRPVKPSGNPFAIRDNDLTKGDQSDFRMKEDGTFSHEEDDDNDLGEFQSRAEKELYEALMKNK